MIKSLFVIAGIIVLFSYLASMHDDGSIIACNAHDDPIACALSRLTPEQREDIAKKIIQGQDI